MPRPAKSPRAARPAPYRHRRAQLRHLVDLRHPAPLEMRRRDAIRAGTDLDSVPAHPGRPESRKPDDAEAVGRRLHAVARATLPLAGLGRAGWRQARGAANGQARRLLRLRQRRLDAVSQVDWRKQPNATARQKVISEIMSGVERRRIDTEKNLLDVLDKVDALNLARHRRHPHLHPLSQVYEGLLLKMGEKGNDGGQFFTPREIIRAMVRAIDPTGRRDGLRSLLRHRRLSRPVVRARALAQGMTRRPTKSRRSARARSSGAKRKTSSIRSPSPIWCCTASTSRISGTATR